MYNVQYNNPNWGQGTKLYLSSFGELVNGDSVVVEDEVVIRYKLLTGNDLDSIAGIEVTKVKDVKSPDTKTAKSKEDETAVVDKTNKDENSPESEEK